MPAIEMRKSREKLRLEVLSHYGGESPRCANPYGLHKAPFGIVELLTISGPKGSLGGLRLYQWLREHDFPRGYRVLCFNCAGFSQVRRYRRGEVKGSFGTRVSVVTQAR